LHKRFKESEVLIMTDYRGLNVDRMSELRHRLREEGVEFRVVKNTLLGLAVRDTGMAEAAGSLEGPTAIALHASEAGVPARILAEFAKRNEALKIKGGVISGKLYSARQIEAVGRLPGREELLAVLAGTLKSGPGRLLGVISAMPRNMAGVLFAFKEARALSS
jgi:large subunit ribosomal protein L10